MRPGPAQLLQRLAVRGDAPFLAAGGRGAGAAEFVRRARELAAGLRARGFSPGDRLAVWLPRSLEEALALFAAWIAGGIAVPLDVRLKDRQVRHVLDDCAPWGMVVSGSKCALLADPDRTLAGPVRLDVDEGLPSAQPEDPATPGDLSEPDADAGAVILYTSGSTGPPKGVVQSRRNLARGAEVVADYLGLTEADHLLGVLPLSFDYGLNQLLTAAWTGCRITCADYLAAADLGRLLQATAATGLAGVPALWHDLARALETGVVDPTACRSLRFVTNSGGRLMPGDLRILRQRLPWVSVFSMYGLTEAFRSAFLPPEEIDRLPHSFGRAIPGVELLLVGPDTGAVLDGPATGELVHAGDLVGLGYWNRGAETEERFRPDPRDPARGTVVYSGDLVRRDAEGYLYFEGRIDGLLKVTGHRVSPDELTAFAAELAEVGEAAVIGVPAGAEGHRLLLFVTAAAPEGDVAARVLRHCRGRLPPWLVPAEIRVLDALPRTPNGKVDLAALRREGEACTGQR